MCLSADILGNFSLFLLFYFKSGRGEKKMLPINKSKEMVFLAKDSTTTKLVLFLNNTRASGRKTERKQNINKTMWLLKHFKSKLLKVWF